MTKPSQPAQRHGYLVIDKPAGWTSHDVVARVRKIVGERRVGHAGTLDPAATGVLPVAVGLATRTIEYLSAATKAYRAEIVFGVTTDSHDRDGRLLEVRSLEGLTAQVIEQSLVSMHGDQLQIPPAHSAIKVGGRRSFDLARAGAEQELAPRAITLSRLDLVEWDNGQGRLVLDVDCSKGTYIRSLARDLGEKVGTGAYLASLIRTRTGPFTLSEAIDLDTLAECMERGGWKSLAWHPDAAMMGQPALMIACDGAEDWSFGRPISSPADVSGAVSVYDWRGLWIGIGEAVGSVCKPVKVVSLEALE